MPFEDRASAGALLAQALLPWKKTQPIVAALPRGGVPVAIPIAQLLDAPLTLIMVRKLGVPGHEEYAFGAIGEDDSLVLDQATIRALGLDETVVQEIRSRESRELKRRAMAYGIPVPMDFSGRTVIIADDGLATGATMRAAVDVAHHRGASKIVIAVPVAAAEAVRDLASRAEVVALEIPHDFRAVGLHYRQFPQVSDDEVTRAFNS